MLITPDPPEPVQRAIMLQSWQALTFLHWRYDASLLRPLVPPHLTLDTFDGSAWLTLAPFLLCDLRMPAVPMSSTFPETNLRTYVRGPGDYPGIWFFSLDAARLSAVLGARAAFGLPYMWARMTVERQGARVHYRSVRRWPFGSAANDVIIEHDDPCAAHQLGELDHFLTARFRLYALRRGRLVFGQVEHPRWPLAEVRLIHLETDLARAAGLLPPRGEPLVHYSERVDVRIAAARRWK